MPSRARRLAVRLASELAARSGWTALARRRRRRRDGHHLFILEYHDVTGGREREGVISRRRFAEHVSHLAQRGRLLGLGEALDRLDAGELDEDLIVLTFDDGLIGNAEHAWPVARDAGAPMTIFLTTGFLDGRPLWFDVARRALAAVLARPADRADPVTDPVRRARLAEALGAWPPAPPVEPLVRRLKYLPPERRRRAVEDLMSLPLPMQPAALPIPWERVPALAAEGVEFGAHTRTHPILSLLDAEEQAEEIVGSRRRIAEAAGLEVDLFAYPNGSARDFDDATVDILRRSGFRAACTTIRGANGPGADRLRLHRLGVGSDAPAVLDARLAGLFDQGVRRRLRRLGLGA